MQTALHFPTKLDAHLHYLSSWRTALEQGDLHTAVDLEHQHYNHLVKPTEDAYFWDLWQQDTLSMRHDITREINKQTPLKTSSASNGRFLLVFHNYSGLAHESQLARNLNFLREQGEALDFEIAYLFGGLLEHHELSAGLYGLPRSAIHFLGAKSYPDAGDRLEQLTNQREYATLIYPSTFFMAYWMSILVSHSNQKFLQMKYFPLHAGRFSAWGCGRKDQGSHFTVQACSFQQLGVLKPSIDSGLKAKRPKNLKRVGQTKLNFGSISRPEKVGDAHYNQFVLSSLEQHPELNYLYAGRENTLQAIPAPVRQHPRSQTLGWVQPEVAIAEFDIYLESFPWGGGDMSLLALASGLPYLILDTPQNRTIGIFQFLEVIAAERDPVLQWSFCDSITTLSSRLEALLKDADMRYELGQAWASAVNNYTPNDSKAWLSFLRT
jgi:hypothetical protein